MDQNIKIATLQQDPIAADVSTVLFPGYISIKGLPPFRKEDFVSVTSVAPVAEVPQFKLIGGNSAVTIAVNTKYSIGIGNTGDQREGWQNSLAKYPSYKLSALSGTAATDRWNIYNSIVFKAMQLGSFRKNMAYVGVRVTLTHVGSTPFTVLAGGPIWVQGATSGTRGFIWRNADSTAVLTELYVTNGIAPVVGDILSRIADPYTGRNPTGAGGPSTAVTVVALGVSIGVLDVVDYYSATGTRKGINTVTTPDGFAALGADIVTTVAGVYSIGQGSRLLQDVPVREISTGNLASGQWAFPDDAVPLAAATYQTIIVAIRPNYDISALSDIGGQADLQMLIFANIAGTSGGYAAYAAALAALTGGQS